MHQLTALADGSPARWGLRPGAFVLGVGSGPAAAAGRPVLCVLGGTSDGDAGDGGEVRRGTLGQRRVTHLHQEVALVDDASACRIMFVILVINPSHLFPSHLI